MLHSRPRAAATALVLAGLVLAALPLAPAAPGPVASDALAWSNAASPGGGPVQGIGGNSLALVASTWGKGTYRSTDGGVQWTLIEGFPDVNEARVAFDPTNPLVGYVAGFGGVARTRDGGLTWDQPIVSAACYRIDVSPTGRVAVSVRESDSRTFIYVSDDQLDSWTKLDPGLPLWTSLYGLQFGRHDGEIIAMEMSRLYVTHDDGATWTTQSTGGLDLAMDDAGALWRVALGSLQRSTDGGDTWSVVNAPAAQYPIAARPGGGLYMASFEGILLTLDDGATWTSYGFGDATFGALSLLPDPVDPDAVFMTDENVGIVRIGPDGAGGYVLEGRSSGLPPVPVTTVGGSADGSLFLAGGPLGVYASHDEGATWAHTGAAMGMLGVSAVVAGADGSTAYAGGQNRIFQPFVFSSVDGGRTFHFSGLDGGGDARVTGIAVNAADPLNAFAAVQNPLANSYLYETKDGGVSWSAVIVAPIRFYDVAWNAETSTLLLTTQAGLIAFDAGIPTPRVAGAFASSGSVASAGGVAVATGGSGVLWRGENAANVLTPWGSGPSGTVWDLTLDPTGETAWATTTTGTLHRCAGATPVCEDVTPPSGSVRGAFVTPDGARVLAASTSDGLWTATL